MIHGFRTNKNSRKSGRGDNLQCKLVALSVTISVNVLCKTNIRMYLDGQSYGFRTPDGGMMD